MSVNNFAFVRNASFVVIALLLAALVICPPFASEGQELDAAGLDRQMEGVKAQLESPKSSADTRRKYNELVARMSECSTVNWMLGEKVAAPLAPTASLCISAALAVADPDYNRVITTTSGTGVGTGVVGNCSLSVSGTAVNYDVYGFFLSGCAAFPTEVTATLCGPAGCQHIGNVDTTLVLYRNTAAGDPLTGNGGIVNPFNPASACTNARGASDDLGTTTGTQHNPGGATCNQVVPAQCLTPCTTPANAAGLSGFRRQLGDGYFTLVVGGFGNGTTGSYNLYVNAPAAGCTLAAQSTAASANLGGRITTAGGNGIRNVEVTISGGNLSEPRMTRTGSFGYYSIEGLEAGQTYIVSVSAKRYTFITPNRTVTLQDSVADVDFTSTE